METTVATAVSSESLSPCVGEMRNQSLSPTSSDGDPDSSPKGRMGSDADSLMPYSFYVRKRKELSAGAFDLEVVGVDHKRQRQAREHCSVSCTSSNVCSASTSAADDGRTDEAVSMWPPKCLLSALKLQMLNEQVRLEELEADRRCCSSDGVEDSQLSRRNTSAFTSAFTSSEEWNSGMYKTLASFSTATPSSASDRSELLRRDVWSEGNYFLMSQLDMNIAKEKLKLERSGMAGISAWNERAKCDIRDGQPLYGPFHAGLANARPIYSHEGSVSLGVDNGGPNDRRLEDRSGGIRRKFGSSSLERQYDHGGASSKHGTTLEMVPSIFASTQVAAMLTSQSCASKQQQSPVDFGCSIENQTGSLLPVQSLPAPLGALCYPQDRDEDERRQTDAPLQLSARTVVHRPDCGIKVPSFPLSDKVRIDQADIVETVPPQQTYVLSSGRVTRDNGIKVPSFPPSGKVRIDQADKRLQKTYVLSSGRLSRDEDALCDIQATTIDLDFDEYFSNLNL